MLPNVGMGELIVILIIILILFGPKRLPEVAKGIGKSIKAFKEGLQEGISETSDTAPKVQVRPPENEVVAKDIKKETKS